MPLLQDTKIGAPADGVVGRGQPAVFRRPWLSTAEASESVRPAGPSGEPVLQVCCRQCAAQNVCVLAELEHTVPAPRDQALLRVRVLRAGEHLFHAGDPLRFLHVVKSGSCKVYSTSTKGSEQVVGFHMPGDLLGTDALAGRAHPSSALALETTAVCTVPLNRVEQVAARYAPAWFIRVLAEEVVREQRMLLMLNNKSAEARLAAFLLTLSERFEVRGYSPRDIKLSMPRQDIANHLGLTVETISRTFSRLQLAHLLEVNHRRVVIRDFQALHALADLQPAERHAQGERRVPSASSGGC